MKPRPQHVLTVVGPPKSGKSETLRELAKEYAEGGLDVLFIDADHSVVQMEAVFKDTEVIVWCVSPDKAVEWHLKDDPGTFDVIVVDTAQLLRTGLFDLARLAKERNCAFVTAQQVRVPDKQPCEFPAEHR